MKKILILPVLALFLVLTAGFVSACGEQGNPCKNSTIVQGTVYQGDNINNVVSGASVNVTCYHKEHNKLKAKSLQTITNSTGDYIVYFEKKDCRKKDNVTVQVQYNGMTGESKGTVKKEEGVNKMKRCRIANVDVPLVPEFGFFAGALTLVSSAIIFFIVRR